MYVLLIYLDIISISQNFDGLLLKLFFTAQCNFCIPFYSDLSYTSNRSQPVLLMVASSSSMLFLPVFHTPDLS
ncbi:hypothetical protein DAI22_03g229400 [Oryza sativa Japonica Group]|nr:hypothetical protein DAI22_03g229400 [Oryza sativa Japonica Group]